jgi:hypothetical protein
LVIQDKTLDLIRSLVSDGMFEVGDLMGEGGRFVAWKTPLNESIQRIRDVYVTKFEDAPGGPSCRRRTAAAWMGRCRAGGR